MPSPIYGGLSSLFTLIDFFSLFFFCSIQPLLFSHTLFNMGTSVPVGVKSKQLRNMYRTPYLAQRGNIHDLDMMKPTKTIVRSESTTFKRHKHRVTWREKVSREAHGKYVTLHVT